jgi:tetratricopeptide (TPR) repeat protein
MNEHGIVIGGHFMAYSGADSKGASFTVLENEIMRHAGSLEEAIGLVKTTKRSGAFGLTIAEGKTGQAVAMEASPERLGVRNMNNHTLVMTNYALTKELEEVDLLPRYSLMMRNVAGRYLRFQQIIKANFGQIAVENMAAFMGDHIDPFLLQERGTGNTICNQTNVTSVVFQPSTGKFWVATGDEPVCGNPYQGYDFASGFQNIAITPSNSILSGYKWQTESRNQGVNHYMKAIVARNDDLSDLDRVLTIIKKAAAADPTEPIYSKNLARILIHQGKYRQAIEVLTQSMQESMLPNERALALLLVAQAYDLLGERENALAFYRKVTSLNNNGKISDHSTRLNHFVNTYAEAGLRSPFKEKQINEIPIISEFLD